MREDWEASLVV